MQYPNKRDNSCNSTRFYGSYRVPGGNGAVVFGPPVLGIPWYVSMEPAGWRKETGGSRCGELIAGGSGGASG
jgi:hypothetical protein